MSQEIADILEKCLQQIAAGTATVQDCLAQHPGLTGELEPLLRAAERARAVEPPRLSLQTRARIEARLVDALASAPPVQPVSRPRLTRLQVWRWAAAGLITLVAVIFLATVGVVAAVTAPVGLNRRVPGAGASGVGIT